MKSRTLQGFRHVLAVLLVLGFTPVVVPFLYAQTSAAPADSAPPPASPAATTNAAPVTAAPQPVTNSAPGDAATNAAPMAPAATTTTDVSPTNAPTNAPGSEVTPPSPGEISGSGSGSASGGEMIGPPAPGTVNAPAGAVPPGQEGAMPGNNPAVTDVTNNPDAVAGLGQRKSPFYFGLDLGEMYDDNILLSPDGQKKDSFITHITPSIDYQHGDQTAPHMNYLNLYFAPSVYLYNSRSGYDRIDYNGDIYYQYNWTRLSVGVEENYQHLTDATLDEGTFVSRNIYTTKITADYIYNDDLTLYGTSTQALNSYPHFTTNEWDVDLFGLYQIAPKLLVGAGPRFAWLDIQDAPNETHQDLLFRLRYLPDQKVSITFDGGAEYLQYEDNTPSRILPIFDANLSYSPFDDTNLFLTGSRTTINSYDIRGDTIDFTTVQIGASQHFLQKFMATAAAGYNLAEYQDTAGVTGNQRRTDNYYFAKGSLNWYPNRWLTVEASYQWSNQDSTFARNTFTDNQVDLQSTVKF